MFNNKKTITKRNHYNSDGSKYINKTTILKNLCVNNGH